MTVGNFGDFKIPCFEIKALFMIARFLDPFPTPHPPSKKKMTGEISIRNAWNPEYEGILHFSSYS